LTLTIKTLNLLLRVRFRCLFYGQPIQISRLVPTKSRLWKLGFKGTYMSISYLLTVGSRVHNY
jgi:hypothetical protein